MNIVRSARALVIVAIGLALVAGCSSTPSPTAAPPVAPPSSALPALPARASLGGAASPRALPPEQRDPAFLAALDEHQLVVADSPQDTVRYGQIICAHLAVGEPVPQLIGEVQSTAQLDVDSTGFVIGAAAAVYCPDDIAKLPQQ